MVSGVYGEALRGEERACRWWWWRRDVSLWLTLAVAIHHHMASPNVWKRPGSSTLCQGLSQALERGEQAADEICGSQVQSKEAK